MNLPFSLDNVRCRPLMVLPVESFDCICSYLLGIDSACNGDFLKGFNEWLAPTVGYGDNLAWTALILHLTFPNSQMPRRLLNDSSHEKSAIACLFRHLEEFLEFKTLHGISQIMFRHQMWLENHNHG